MPRDPHVDTRFSEAYDGALDEASRRRFDDHLARCSECAARFAHFAAAIDAVRGLPAARMPVPVRLPSTAPQPVRTGVIETIRAWRPPRPVALAGTLGGLAAAAAVAAVVVAGHGGGTPSQNAAAPPGVALNGPVPTGDRRSAAQSAPQPGGAAALAPQLAGPAAIPAGYDNAVTVTIPGRPGERLILATPRRTYHPGETISVYSLLVGSSAAGPVASVPEVRLTAAGGGAVAGSPDPRASAPPLAAAVPATAPAAAAGGLPAAPPVPGLLTLTVPASLRPGQAVELVASAPAGVPAPADTVPIAALVTVGIG